MKDKVKLADPTRTVEKYIEQDNAFRSIKLKALKQEWLNATGVDAKLKVIGKVLGLVD